MQELRSDTKYGGVVRYIASIYIPTLKPQVGRLRREASTVSDFGVSDFGVSDFGVSDFGVSAQPNGGQVGKVFTMSTSTEVILRAWLTHPTDR